MLGRRILDPEHVESGAEAVDGLGLLDAVTTFAGDKRTVRVEGELIGSRSGEGWYQGAPAPRPAGPPSLRLVGPDDGPPAPLSGRESVLGPEFTRLRGYEIHMGRTAIGGGAAPLLRLRGADGSEHDDGAVSADGVVCGSYVHGLFDHPALRTTFLNGLRLSLGLEPRDSLAPTVEDDLERLADHVEAHLDAELLARIVGLEPIR